MISKIINGIIISEGKQIKNSSIYFSENEIIAITDRELPHDKVIDAKGNFVSAGFIDLHVHGGGGYDFMDGGVEPILKAADFHLKHGTTTIFPTSLACSTNVLKQFLSNLRVAREKFNTIEGAHLEGPYFSTNQCGAQNLDYIKSPPPDEYEDIINSFGDVISRWSFAPEHEGSEQFCEYLKSSNIVPSIAHSDAVFDDVVAVHDKGCKLITHFYSCMSTITRHNGYRKLGIIECAYLFDDIFVEVIADNCHLPKDLLQLILKQKGINRICLVTDAMRAAGMESGKSYLGTKDEATPCIIEDGVAKLTDRSAFAGSIATADRLVRTMFKIVGTDICDAIAMITKTPADIMKLDRKGDIKKGYAPDFVIFDEDIQIKNVIKNGLEIEL